MKNRFVSFKKIIIFGAEGVGKTNLLYLMKPNEFIHYSNCENKLDEIQYIRTSIQLPNKESIYANIYEVKINSKFIKDINTINTLLYECQYAFLLVDITKQDSFQLIKDLINSIKIESFPYLNCIFIENKNEQKTKINNNCIKEYLELKPFIKSVKISIENEDINELFFEIEKTIDQKDTILSSNMILEPNYDSYEMYINNINFKAKASLSFILLGNSYVGKSDFLSAYFNRNNNFLTTVGLDKVSAFVKFGKDVLRINIWDTAGQERFRSLPIKYYNNTDGVFLLIDINYDKNFNEATLFLEDIRKNLRKRAIIFLIGNNTNERIISREKVESFAKLHKLKYFEINIKYKINIHEVFNTMIIEFLKKNPSIIGKKNLDIINEFKKNKYNVLNKYFKY